MAKNKKKPSPSSSRPPSDSTSQNPPLAPAISLQVDLREASANVVSVSSPATGHGTVHTAALAPSQIEDSAQISVSGAASDEVAPPADKQTISHGVSSHSTKLMSAQLAAQHTVAREAQTLDQPSSDLTSVAGKHPHVNISGLLAPSSLDGKTSSNNKPSWTDIVSGNGSKMSKKGTPFIRETGELCVKIPNSVITKNKKSWDNFVIGQFQGKPPTPGTLYAILNGIWSNKMRDITVSKLTEKAFLIRIPNAATRTRVLSQVMWHIDNQSMFVAKWEPGLSPIIPELTSVPVWLEFRKVPPQFYNIDGLEYIAGLIGDPKFLHPTTASMTNLEVAKVFTIVDPTQPIPETISVQFESGEFHSIEASCPWLPPICPFCNLVGHSLRSCPTAPITCAECNSSGHPADMCSRIKNKRMRKQATKSATIPVAKPADGVRVKPAAAPCIRIITPPGPVPKTKEKESTSTRKGKEIEAPSEAPSGYNSSIAAGNVSAYSSGDTSGSDWSSGEDDNPDDDNEHFVPYVSKKLMRQLEALRKKQSPRGNRSKYSY